MINDKVRKFSKSTREIDDLTVEALEKFAAHFVHANDKPELSEKALKECMAKLVQAGNLICALHDTARIELTGEDKPTDKVPQMKFMRYLGVTEPPPFVIDPEEFGIGGD